MIRSIVSCALPALFFLGCAGPKPAGGGASQAPALTFGVVPLGEQAARTKEVEGLIGVLEQALGGRVALTVAADYREFSKGLSERRWDLVMVGPVLYSRAHEHGYDAVAMGKRDGAFVRQGTFVARADKTFEGVEGLRGKKIAFVSPHSSAGFQFPFAYLFAHGLAPADYTRQFLGSYEAVVKAVLDGSADVGTTYDGAIQDLAGENALLLKVIAKTDPIPGEAFAVRSDCRLLPRIREVLLTLHQRKDGAALLAPLHADELVTPPDGVFEAAKNIDLLVNDAAGL